MAKEGKNAGKVEKSDAGKTAAKARKGATKKATTKKSAARKKAATKKKSVSKKSAAKKAAAKKTVPGKSAAKKAAVKKKGTAARKSTGRSSPGGVTAKGRQVSAAERNEMIAQAAYLRSEAQGFLSDAREDWLVAEAEVDGRLAKAGAVVTD